jgi:putative spermidine/putrescine transport system substrate-binding protein
MVVVLSARAATMLVVALALFAVDAARAAEELTIASWGGSYASSQREAYFVPFTRATGIAIAEQEYNGELDKLRQMVASGSVTWDIVDVDTATAVRGCNDGLLEAIDWSRIGDRSKFIPGAALDCGVGSVVWALVFAYDGDRIAVADGPTSWADFWSIKTWPGKRGLRRTPVGNLELALLADGVPREQVYATLRSDEGVARAFAKLDEIKSQIAWWETGEDAPKLLLDGTVVMTTAYNGRIYSAAKSQGRNLAIVWEGQLYDLDYWAIPKGAGNSDLAYRFIAFASDPSVMARQSDFISYGPVHVEAITAVDPAVLPHLPTAPDNFANALPSDYDFWAEKQDELTERFNAWLEEK